MIDYPHLEHVAYILVAAVLTPVVAYFLWGVYIDYKARRNPDD